jgi:metal-responsive CopG/Arc/MetJ family transcriptional regulator
MKVKTLITLSDDLLATIDEFVEQSSKEYETRSAFLESAAWSLIEQIRRVRQTALDIEIINRRAEYLNAETMDALTYL